MPQARPPYALEFRRQMIELVRAGATRPIWLVRNRSGFGARCVSSASSGSIRFAA